MTRITNEQREAIVRKAVAERDALLAVTAPVPHLSLCASQDDTMAKHPACDCGADYENATIAAASDRIAELEHVARLTASVQVAPGHGYDLDAMDAAIVAARKVLAGTGGAS